MVIILLMVIMAGIFGVITFTVYLLIPSLNASDRKDKINKGLPYAVTFMYALSKGGMDIISILRALHEAESTYGEVSRERGLIIRDMDYFGHDLRTAILNCISQSPSDLLQIFLESFIGHRQWWRCNHIP